MQKRTLITGISGFAGSYLAEHLLSLGFEIFGTYLSESRLENIASIKSSIHLEKIDLLDSFSIESFLEKINPNYVFHLAAMTAPSKSFDNPAKVFINNITGQINLLEGIRNKKLNPKILIISSGDIYGMVAPKDLPIDEKTELKPVNPYAVSKIAQDFLGFQYSVSYGLDIVRVRPFNHIGPRQSPNFVVASFCRKIADAEKGKTEPILSVGNLEAKRDFTDVRDIVKAYALIIEKGDKGEVYNIGSGISHKIEEIVNMLISLAKVKIEIKIDQSLLRPSDEPELVCDNKKLVEKTDWKPEIFLEKTLTDTLDYWRNII